MLQGRSSGLREDSDWCLALLAAVVVEQVLLEVMGRLPRTLEAAVVLVLPIPSLERVFWTAWAAAVVLIVALVVQHRLMEALVVVREPLVVMLPLILVAVAAAVVPALTVATVVLAL